MEFTQKDWGQRDIINIIIILIKWVTNIMHAVIPETFQKYPPTTILKHANFLAKVNQLFYVRLINMTPFDA